MICRCTIRWLQRKYPHISLQNRKIWSEFSYISSTLQPYIIDFQQWTTLPWWLSIGCSTLLVRSAIFPLVRQQIIASRNLMSAMPEISLLNRLVRTKLSTLPLNRFSERFAVLKTYTNGIRACLIVHKVNTWEIILYPCFNISIFVSFVYTVRSLVLHGTIELAMETGGAFWFVDLSERDHTFLLPLLASSLSYLAIDLATTPPPPPPGSLAPSSPPPPDRFLLLFKDILQTIILLSVPAICQLPAGVFCYWIPSSIYGMIQSQALKSPDFQTLFRIPPPPSMNKRQQPQQRQQPAAPEQSIQQPQPKQPLAVEQTTTDNNKPK